MISGEFDVVVVGAGNAGMCAALAARGEGARVLVLEAAPFDERGGNSRYTAGALRFVYNGVDDLLKLCDLSETEVATSDFGTYTTDKYYDDLGRLTNQGYDRHQLAPMVLKAQQATGCQQITAVADRGYFNGDQVLSCEGTGVAPVVPKTLTSSGAKRGCFTR